MNVVILGAGRIGCGFAGALLHASGLQPIFIARNQALVDHFNRVGRYQVRLVDRAKAETYSVDGIQAIHSDQVQQVTAAIAQADLIVTAVGAGNLSAVAPLIATGLQERHTAVNILAFENHANADSHLRTFIAQQMPAAHSLDEHGCAGVLVSRVVTERKGSPLRDEPLTFIGDPPATFVVDGTNLGPPLPDLRGMKVTDQYSAWTQRKLYTYSAGHATAAYLGYLKGYHYIHTAIRDPEIRAAVFAAMVEGQRGLAACYGSAIAGTEQDLLDILARFDNAALNDPIQRVGRDPRRKLGAHDRLAGAARLALTAGTRPDTLALAMAAALHFDEPTDPLAGDLQQEIQYRGTNQILRQVSELDPNQGIGRSVSEAWTQPEAPVLIQELIPGSGEDLKVYVVGEEVFAVRKSFAADSFTKAGRPSPVSAEVCAIALRCGQAFGLGLYGLDIIESPDGPVVVDLNYFPRYKGVPDVAPLIADYIERFACGLIETALPTPLVDQLPGKEGRQTTLSNETLTGSVSDG